MICKFCVYPSPKVVRKALLFDYEEIARGTLKNAEDGIVHDKHLEDWAAQGQMALFDSFAIPTTIHVYLNEAPPTAWLIDAFPKPLQSWLSLRSGKIACLSRMDFREWVLGDSGRDVLVGNTAAIPAGVYLADIFVPNFADGEVDAAIDRALGVRKHYWLKKVQELFGKSACLVMGCAPPLFLAILLLYFNPLPWLWPKQLIQILGAAAVLVVVLLLLSIAVNALPYFKKLEQRRGEVLQSFPMYCVVLRPAPQGFVPSDMPPPMYDGVYRDNEAEQKRLKPRPKNSRDV